MARQIPLNLAKIEDKIDFSYANVMIEILRIHPNGVIFEEMLLCLAVIKELEEAQKNKAKEVILEDEHWRVLRDKLKVFKFTIVDEVVVEFCKAILDAPLVKLDKAKVKVIKE